MLLLVPCTIWFRDRVPYELSLPALPAFWAQPEFPMKLRKTTFRKASFEKGSRERRFAYCVEFPDEVAELFPLLMLNNSWRNLRDSISIQSSQRSLPEHQVRMPIALETERMMVIRFREKMKFVQVQQTNLNWRPQTALISNQRILSSSHSVDHRLNGISNLQKRSKQDRVNTN